MLSTIATFGFLGLLCGRIESTRKEWAVYCLKAYNKEFGTEKNKQFEQTIIENEMEFALQVQKEIDIRGIIAKLEDYKKINKWLMIACYFNKYETKNFKNKMQFYTFLLFFQYCKFLSKTA